MGSLVIRWVGAQMRVSEERVSAHVRFHMSARPDRGFDGTDDSLEGELVDVARGSTRRACS